MFLQCLPQGGDHAGTEQFLGFGQLAARRGWLDEDVDLGPRPNRSLGCRENPRCIGVLLEDGAARLPPLVIPGGGLNSTGAGPQADGCSLGTESLATPRWRGTGFEPSVPREAASILVISVLASKSRTLPTTGPGQPCSTLDRGGVIARLSRLQRVHWAPSPKTAASREAGSCGRCPGGSRGGAGGAAEDIVLG